MREVLCDLQTRVQKAKLNVESITQLVEVALAGVLQEGSCRDSASPEPQTGPVFFLQECSATPLYERKDNKETAFLDLDGRENTFSKRCAAMKDAGRKIQELLEVRCVLEH